MMGEKATTTALRANKRITFQTVRENAVQKEFHLDLYMPETYSLDEPGRVTATQTRGGGFVDNFGLGFGSVTIGGTTGWKTRPNVNRSSQTDDTVDGYERWVGLREFFRDFFHRQTDAPAAQFTMNFLNWTQEDYLRCVPMGLPRLMRNVAQPLLFRYELTMTVLNRLEKEGYAQGQVLLATLGTDTKRAGVIADQINAKLDSQWQAFVTGVQNATSIPQLSQVAQDANAQAFVSQILQRYTPAGYQLPTDSKDGLVTRTRTLGQRITDFANSKTAFVESTIAEGAAVVQGWRDVLDAVDYAVYIPASYAREAKELLCACQSILLYPQLFRNSVQATFSDLNALLADSGCASTLRL